MRFLPDDAVLCRVRKSGTIAAFCPRFSRELFLCTAVLTEPHPQTCLSASLEKALFFWTVHGPFSFARQKKMGGAFFADIDRTFRLRVQKKKRTQMSTKYQKLLHRIKQKRTKTGSFCGGYYGAEDQAGYLYWCKYSGN